MSDYDLSDLETAVERLASMPVQGDSIMSDDLDSLADRWQRIREMSRQLSVIERDYALAVGSILADMEYNRAEGFPLHNGTRIRHEQSKTERWQGRRLLRALSTPMVEPSSGEVVESIPLKVLADIIPGVASDDATSSRWRTTGLRNIDINPDDYRETVWGQPRAELGGRGR